MSKEPGHRRGRAYNVTFQVFRVFCSFVFIPWFLASTFYSDAQRDRRLGSQFGIVGNYPARWASGRLEWGDVRHRTIRLLTLDGQAVSLTCGVPILPSSCIRAASISLPAEVHAEIVELSMAHERINVLLSMRDSKGTEIVNENNQRRVLKSEARYLSSTDPNDHWWKAFVGGLLLGLIAFVVIGLIGKEG